MTQLELVTGSALFHAARAVIHETDTQTVQHMCDATSLPAPTFSEAQRGQWLAARLQELGLEPAVDDVGNVSAVSPAAEPDSARVVIASHLDTVFPADTDLTIHSEDGQLRAPGISDNSRGLAGLLAIARSLHAAGWPTRRPVVFLGSVGEEGVGDLYGVKHYVAQHGSTMSAFIALDGAGATRIINAGVGSRRLRVTFRGPGGHSWSDFGAPNAIHAVGRAIASVSALPLPTDPRTSLTVARVGGGTSINSIPADAWLELDLRSEAAAPLAELEAAVRAAMDRARSDEAAAAELTVEIRVFGDRPAGRTAEDQPLVQAALAATRAVGLAPQLASSSTDANVAMAAGIPAIAIGAGGEAGGTHTLKEWYTNTNGAAGIERALLVVLAAAEIDDSLPPGRRAAGGGTAG